MPLSPRIEATKPLVLAGRNNTYKIGPNPGMKDQWALFMEDFGKIAGQVGYLAYGVCHNFDGQGHMDYLVAAEVKDAGEVAGYLTTLIIPARKTAVFVHEGPLSKISQTWMKIFDEGLPASKLEVAPGPQFEVYGADFDAADENSRVEIFIPVT
jgi:AraC family transcriptional regulator